MTDPIADMLTRIRNAGAAGIREVVLPYSRMKFDIAKILEREGYLSGVEKLSQGTVALLRLLLRYDGDTSAISAIERVSSPGCRVYVSSSLIPRVRSNQGIAIISTSAGIMTGREARARKLGGEVICKVY